MLAFQIFVVLVSAAAGTRAASPDARGGAIVVNTWPFVNATAKAWTFLTHGYPSVQAVVEVRHIPH
jgi:hypothetical protein